MAKNATPPGRHAAPESSRRDKIQQAAGSVRTGPSPMVIGGVVAIVAIIVVVAWTIIANNNAKSAQSKGGSQLPKGVAAMGQPFTRGTPAAGAPTLDIYEDFQCPGCHQFETTFGAAVRAMAEAGTAKVNYHIMSFLDDRYRGENSVRAATGAFCAAAFDRFGQFHDSVYANAPAKEGQGWTDAQLEQFATDSGITGADLTSWKTCYTGRAMQQYIVSMETAGEKDGIVNTPTIKLNGTAMTLDGMDPASFTKAVTGK
ncbi:MAG: thioredoxin domain-containing protein [Tetrasphaera sp.]|nr:thioredoxin domain-containing protein [Tetrasphaera sp.]